MIFKLNWSYLKWYFLAIVNEYPSGLITKSVTGNRITFDSHQNLDSEMILSANYKPFFNSFVLSPPRESFVKLWKRASEICFICSKLGPNLSEISGSQDICQDTESNLGPFAGF